MFLYILLAPIFACAAYLLSSEGKYRLGGWDQRLPAEARRNMPQQASIKTLASPLQLTQTELLLPFTFKTGEFF
jgi:hypothetical protein